LPVTTNSSTATSALDTAAIADKQGHNPQAFMKLAK
jgi:hypothetical protein